METFGNGPRDRLIWFDAETTGLDEDVDVILEVALVETTWDLDERRHVDFAIHFQGDVFPPMARNVLQMHAASGLLKDVAMNGVNLADAERFIVEWVGDYGGPRAGRTPSGVDARFLRRHMPLLNRCFDHRCFDVSSLKQAHRMWIGDWPKDKPSHRALDDVRACIEECRELRSALLGSKERIEVDIGAIIGSGPNAGVHHVHHSVESPPILPEGDDEIPF